MTHITLPLSHYTPATIDHLSHQILTQLRGFAYVLPPPGILVPTPHALSLFVRLASSGLKLKVTLSPLESPLLSFLAASYALIPLTHFVVIWFPYW